MYTQVSFVQVAQKSGYKFHFAAIKAELLNQHVIRKEHKDCINSLLL